MKLNSATPKTSAGYIKHCAAIDPRIFDGVCRIVGGVRDDGAIKARLRICADWHAPRLAAWCAKSRDGGARLGATQAHAPRRSLPWRGLSRLRPATAFERP
jgi:hypothetical protein